MLTRPKSGFRYAPRTKESFLDVGDDSHVVFLASAADAFGDEVAVVHVAAVIVVVAAAVLAAAAVVVAPSFAAIATAAAVSTTTASFFVSVVAAAFAAFVHVANAATYIVHA